MIESVKKQQLCKFKKISNFTHFYPFRPQNEGKEVKASNISLEIKLFLFVFLVWNMNNLDETEKIVVGIVWIKPR